MKPLPFDMTPLASSLSLGTNRPAKSAPKTDPAPAPAASVTEPVPVADTPVVDAAKEEAAKIAAEKIEAAEKLEAATAVEEISAEPTTTLASEPVVEETPEVSPAPVRPNSPRTELRQATYPLHIKIHEGWTSQLAQEQIHAMATHILARHAEGKLRTLAVTSALAGEGKTTMTLALAEKLSKAGKKILIIDLDAHRATLSRDSQLDDAAGAMQSSDPRDPTNLDFHVYSTDMPGISIMPAGYPEAAAEGPPLISPVHIGVLVLRAIEDYDIVVLDCPPLLPVADTHVIGEVADSALLVVRAGQTPRAMIDEAIDEFGREKFLGAILNRALPADIPYFREVYGYYRRYSTARE